MPKKYQHINNQELSKILQMIRARIPGGYPKLLRDMVSDISQYYNSIPDIDANGKNKKPQLIIGLSGGIDSSVVTTLAIRAIGPNNVIPITLPHYYDSDSIWRVNLLRTKLGLGKLNTQLTLNIEKVVQTERDLMNNLKWPAVHIDSENLPDKIRIGNFASRVRVSLLYDLQRILNGRVLGTGNRTEYVQGYAAKYGTPLSCDFGILDELYKTDIYELGRLLQIPEEIMNVKPSTGYYIGQTHENELGAAPEEQDAAAYLLFEKNLTPKLVSDRYGFSISFLEKMNERYVASAHKRMLQQPHIQISRLDKKNISKKQVDYTNIHWAPVIHCIIKYNDKILLIQRAEKFDHQFYWSGVSGFLDDQKSVQSKVKEELREEVGITSQQIKSMHLGEIFHRKAPKFKKTWIIHPVLVELHSNQIQLNLQECHDFRWVYLKNINKFRLLPGCKETLRMVLEKD
ncbi:MAG: NH(3)-dependent NAD(+) synthetase [Candidatus Gottesmanbacteria bacterium GW2011_GWA1_42_26]|nr:MAG: NH(3)-dependent NAD(+) synthetase [Candidatus Gottesmanbacteria bacterium GW2011_GWA1_42_26]